MTNTSLHLLSDEEITRIRELRKQDPKKAEKLLKRLKSRKHKKIEKPAKSSKKPDKFSSHDEVSTTDNLTEEDDDFQVPDTSEVFETLASTFPIELQEEFREIYEKFLNREETRASGKGGIGEEFVEFNKESDQVVNDDDTKKKRGGGRGDHSDDDDEDDELDSENQSLLSKRKLKQLRRPTISYLKQICKRPEVVETWDTTAVDPKLLVFLKAYRNTVVVPGHWSHKRRYLQGKRGIERSQFQLPHYIEATRISEIRSAIEAKDAKKTLKQRMREKSRPRHRKLNIDYQTLYDAFFKYATKPTFTRFGDVYFEGKETEMHFRKYVPGKLSERCRDGLGMSSALDAPPWLLNMQRYGPPPSYPNLVVPGVNAHIPEGAALGFQPGGWGKPPTLEQLKLWGVTPRFEEVVLGEDDVEGLDGGGELAYWGALQVVESDEEKGFDEADEETDETNENEQTFTEEAENAHALGIVTPSGFTSTGAITPDLLGTTSSLTSGVLSTDARLGLETPQSVDLRCTDYLSESNKPYTVIEQSKVTTQAGDSLFNSDMIYVVPSAQTKASQPSNT